MPAATAVAASELCAKIKAAIHDPDRIMAEAFDVNTSVSKRTKAKKAAVASPHATTSLNIHTTNVARGTVKNERHGVLSGWLFRSCAPVAC